MATPIERVLPALSPSAHTHHRVTRRAWKVGYSASCFRRLETPTDLRDFCPLLGILEISPAAVGPLSLALVSDGDGVIGPMAH